MSVYVHVFLLFLYRFSSLSSAHMDPSESDHSWPVDVSGIKCNLGSTDGDEEYMDIGELLGVTFVNSDYLESQQRNAAINDISDRGTSVEPTELRISGWKKDECDTADDFTVIFHRRKDGSAKDPEDSLTQIERELDSLSLALNDANRFCPSLQSDTSKTDERSSSGSSDFRSLSNAVVSSDENFSSFEFWRPAIPEIPSSVHSLPISTDESELASFMERRFAFPSTPFNTCLNSERCESAGHQRTVSETTEICQSDSEANKDRNRVNQKATETVSDSLFHPSKLDNCFVVDG